MTAVPVAPCEPTDVDRAWLRAQLGDTGTPPAFSDDQLGALLVAHECDRLAALADGLGVLSAEAVRLTDYALGAVRESNSQIFDHLMERQRAVVAAMNARNNTTGGGMWLSQSIETVAKW